MGRMPYTGPNGRHRKPLSEQRRKPLEFIRGTFSGAASRWSIRCKECYSIYIACKKWHHHVSRPRLFTIWTDHNNLRYLLDPSTTGIKVTKSTMGRLARWIWSIQGLCYRIRVLKGSMNIIADLLSHWGAQGSCPPINEIAKLIRANITVPRPPPDIGRRSHHTSAIKLLPAKAQNISAPRNVPANLYELSFA